MGDYIQAVKGTTKAQTLTALGAKEIIRPISMSDIPKGQSLVVLVDNGTFDAAGVVKDAYDFDEYTSTSDPRNRRYYLLDTKVALKNVSGFE